MFPNSNVEAFLFRNVFAHLSGDKQTPAISPTFSPTKNWIENIKISQRLIDCQVLADKYFAVLGGNAAWLQNKVSPGRNN